MSRGLRCGHPAGGGLLGAVAGDRFAAQVPLVLRGAPAAVDVEHEALAGGVRRGPAHRSEERRVEVGHARDRVVEDRGPVRDRAVGHAESAAVADVEEPVAERLGDRREDGHDRGGQPTAEPAGHGSCGKAVGHALQYRRGRVVGTLAVFDMPTIGAGP
jgi:hypothetical protein